MVKVVTQNDLMDVIQAEITNLNDLIELVTTSINEVIKKISVSNNWKNNSKKYKELLNTIFGEDDGVLLEIQAAVDSLDKFSKSVSVSQIESLIKSNILNRTLEYLYGSFKIFDKINLKYHQGLIYKIKFTKSLLKAISSFVNSLNDIDLSFKQLIVNAINPATISRTMESIGQTFETIQKVKLNPIILIKLKWIKFIINSIRDTLTDILKVSEDWEAMVHSLIMFSALDLILIQLQYMFDLIKEIKISPIIVVKLKWTQFVVKYVVSLIEEISELGKKSTYNKILRATAVFIALDVMLLMLNRICIDIKQIPFLFIVAHKLKRMRKIMALMDPTVAEMSKIGEKTPNYKKMINRWTSILISFTMFKFLLMIIGSIKYPMFINSKLKKTLKIIKGINEINDEINNIKTNSISTKKLEKIIEFVKNIKKLLNMVALMTGPALIALLGMKLISLNIRLMVRCLVEMDVMLKGIPLKALNKKLKLVLKIFAKIELICLSAIAMFAVIVLVVPFALKGLAALALLTLVLLSILGIVKLLLWMSKLLLKGDVMLALTGISTIITILMFLALKLVVLAGLSIIIAANVVNILIFFGILLAIIGAVAVIGWAVTAASGILVPALIGFALIGVVITMLTILAVELLAIQSIKLDEEKIKANVSTIIGTCYYIIDNIFNTEDETEEKESKGIFGQLIKYVGGPIVKILGALMAIPFLALSLASISIITIMASELRLIQLLDLDPELVKSNVNTVLDTCQSVIDIIFEREDDTEEKEGKGIFAKIISFVGGIGTDLISAIMAIPILTLTFAATGIIIMIAKRLEALQKITLDPKAIGNNLLLVISTADIVIDEIINRPDTSNPEASENVGLFKSILNFVAPKLSDIADAMGAIGFLLVTATSVGIVKMIAEDLNTISGFTIEGNITTKVTSIITAANKVVDSIMGDESGFAAKAKEFAKNTGTSLMLKSLMDPVKFAVDIIDLFNKAKTVNIEDLNKKADFVDRIFKSIGDLSKNNLSTNKNNILTDATKFIKAIDNTKLDKLAKANSMFEQMAKFSESIQGNFEGLADSLNEKIAPLLEELKGLIGELPKSSDISTASANISSSISANAGGPTLTPQATKEQVQRENPQASQEEIERIADEKLKENYTVMSQSITAKFDELIELIRNGEGKIQITD